jgi:hypothetical protein
MADFCCDYADMTDMSELGQPLRELGQPLRELGQPLRELEALADTRDLSFWDALAAAERVVSSPMEVAYAEPLEDFKKLLHEVNNAIPLFYQRPLAEGRKAYHKLLTLLEYCRDKGEQMHHAFAATDLHFHEVSNAAEELIFAYGEHSLNGSAYTVVAQRRVLEAERLELQPNKKLFYDFLDNNVFPFLELLGNIVRNQTGFITLGFILQFVTEGLQVVHRLEIRSKNMHKALFRTCQAMQYSMDKFREGSGSRLDSSDSDTEPEDALNIPVVRKKKARVQI